MLASPEPSVVSLRATGADVALEIDDLPVPEALPQSGHLAHHEMRPDLAS